MKVVKFVKVVMKSFLLSLALMSLVSCGQENSDPSGMSEVTIVLGGHNLILF